MSSTIEAITKLLFIETPLEPVDLIFVFGNDWLETMSAVKSVHDQGISNRILISGHSASKDRSESEAHRFKERGLELGMPDSTFIMEHNATNTKENFEFSLPLIEEAVGLTNIKRILFVCKTFHTRRVLMTARNFLPEDVTCLFLPMIDERNIRSDNWWKDQTARERVMAEIRRIGEYTLKGDLSVF